MKNDFGSIRSLVLIVSLLITSFVQASGEGRNGPDQNGVSIPVSNDQFIKASEFKTAILTCQIAQRNLLLSQILRQEKAFKINSFGEILLYIQDKKDAENFLQVMIRTDVAAVYTESVLKTNSAGNKFQLQSYFPTSLTLVFIPKQDPTYEVYQRQFRSNKRNDINVAYVDSSLIDSLNSRKEMWIRFIGGITVNAQLLEAMKPDGLGFKKEADRLVTNIQVLSNPLINYETNQPTELQVDVKEFNQCLFNELNR